MDRGRPLGIGKVAELRRQLLEESREETLEDVFFRLTAAREHAGTVDGAGGGNG